MLDLVMLMLRMPSLGAADAQGLQTTCPLRGAGCRSRMGWVGGAMAGPGLLGDGSGPAEAQTGIGAGRGSGVRALMLILG
jgi:hypothetical protein